MSMQLQSSIGVWRRTPVLRWGAGWIAALAVGLSVGAAGADEMTENGVLVIRGSEVGGALPSEGEPVPAPEFLLVAVPFEWRRTIVPQASLPPCYLIARVQRYPVWGGGTREGLLQSQYCPLF
jgi:hypothetical protein